MSPSVRKAMLRIPKVELRISVNGKQRHVGAYYPDEGTWRKGQLKGDQVLLLAGNTPGWDLGTFEQLKLDYRAFEYLEFWSWEGVHFKTTVLTMDRLGFTKNFSHGAQRFLDRRHWSEVPENQEVLL